MTTFFTLTLLATIAKYGFPDILLCFVESSIVEVSVNKIALWISICVDDWTARMSDHCYRSGTVNSKSFVGKVLPSN